MKYIHNQKLLLIYCRKNHKQPGQGSINTKIIQIDPTNNNQATVFLANFKGSAKPGQTIHVSKFENLLFLNQADKIIKIFENEAKNHQFVKLDTMKISDGIDSMVALGDDKIVILTKKSAVSIAKLTQKRRFSFLVENQEVLTKGENLRNCKFSGISLCPIGRYLALSLSRTVQAVKASSKLMKSGFEKIVIFEIKRFLATKTSKKSPKKNPTIALKRLTQLDLGLIHPTAVITSLPFYEGKSPVLAVYEQKGTEYRLHCHVVEGKGGCRDFGQNLVGDESGVRTLVRVNKKGSRRLYRVSEDGVLHIIDFE